MKSNGKGKYDIERKFSIFMMKKMHTKKTTQSSSKQRNEEKVYFWYPPFILFCTLLIHAHHEKQYEIDDTVVNNEQFPNESHKFILPHFSNPNPLYPMPKAIFQLLQDCLPLGYCAYRIDVK